MINECQKCIVINWERIDEIQGLIMDQRNQFYQERLKFQDKQDNLTRLCTKLEEDTYIFTIPGKFPEAYRKTIYELQRRKAYNCAVEKLCYHLEKIIKKERSTRDNFNLKYGDYLPKSIQSDLQLQPTQILFSTEDSIVSSGYQFIEKVEIKKEDIIEKLQDIISKVFKHIPTGRVEENKEQAEQLAQLRSEN